MLPMTGQDVSLYVHIPFCKSRCVYCDFTSGIAPDPGVTELYAHALAEELRMLAADHPDRSVLATVYFGGGTPSLLPRGELDIIWNAIHGYFSVRDGEITIEANPDDVTPEKLSGWKACGFNRLSLGFQSLEDRILSLLGRRNTAAQNAASFKMARDAGFGNISVDWIAGVPGENAEITLKGMQELCPDHLSVYQLSVEEGAELKRKATAGEFRPLPDEDMIAGYWRAADDLEAAGYARYEISNFARGEQYQSRHNLNYWNYGQYLGAGLGAAGFMRTENGDSGCFGVRTTNLDNMAAYLEAAGSGRRPEAGREMIDRRTALREFVMLSLRKTAGLEDGPLKALFGTGLEKILPRGIPAGLESLLVREPERIRLTRAGTAVANEVIRRVWVALEDASL